ncbi:MAG TPA: hypothetical protein VKU44_11860 [Terriglobia bacterium]|nr:hypothetical protein [Terriglobia bacterium]
MCVSGTVHAGKATGNVNVTTTVHDHDISGVLLLMGSDDHNGSGQATYGAALNANVQSYIDSNGARYLRLYNQSVRTLYINPNDPINSSQPPGPPAGYYWQNVEVAVGCYDQNLKLVSFQNILTSSNDCKLITDFSDNGTQYKMVIGPNSNPATGLVTAVCNPVSSGQCVSWTIVPNTSPGSPNPTVANLFGPATHKSSGFIGQYHYTFRVDVTNP